MFDASAVAQIETGAYHTCLRLNDGRAMCWGSNQRGELGDGSQSYRQGPVLVRGLSDATDLALGGTYSCAVQATGRLSCWGRHEQGRLRGGEGLVDLGLADVVEVASGEAHACARTNAGEVYCWGSNAAGQVGQEPSPGVSEPQLVTFPSGTRLAALALGDSHSCALSEGGQVLCWGSNASGQLGTGSEGTGSATPALVAGLDEVEEIAAGHAHSCARLRAGGLRCWGSDGVGQVGSQAPLSCSGAACYSAPVPVERMEGGELAAVIEIALGGNTSCARTTEGVAGAIYCWGDSSSNQAGSGSSTVPLAERVGSDLGFSDLVEDAREIALGGSVGTDGSTDRAPAYARTEDRILAWGTLLQESGEGFSSANPTPQTVIGRGP